MDAAHRRDRRTSKAYALKPCGSVGAICNLGMLDVGECQCWHVLMSGFNEREITTRREKRPS